MASATGNGRPSSRTRLCQYGALSLIGASAVATAAAFYFLLSRPLPIGSLRLFGSAVTYGAFALWFCRSPGFAILACAAAVAGMAWNCAVSVSLHAPLIATGLGASVGYVITLFYADNFVARVLEGSDTVDAGLSCVPDLLRNVAAATVLLAAGEAVLANDPVLRFSALVATAQFVLSALAIVLIVPAASVFLRFDELRIAQLNRIRERRIGFAFGLAATAIPRWSWSAGGIAIVVSVLAVFGDERILARSELVIAAIAGAAFVLSLALTRRWRVAAAAMFATVAAVLVGLWGCAAPGRESTADTIALIEAAAAGFVLTLGAAYTKIAKVRDREEPASRIRTGEERAGVVVFSAVGAILALVVQSNSAAVSALVIGASAVGALVFAPSATTLLETILPNRKSVAERYRRH